MPLVKVLFHIPAAHLPKDDGVFRETQPVGGFTLACDAQIYLDLLDAGLRGPEQARALREWRGFGRSKA